MSVEANVMMFSSRDEFRNWLTRNHTQEKGIWIVFKKGNKDFNSTIALEESICFGWIDGIIKSIDSKSYQKYFSKRKNSNNWSEKNQRIYETLSKKCKITRAGIEAYKPTKKIEGLGFNIHDKIEVLRSILSEVKGIVELYDAVAESRQKQLAGFYCDAKTEETKKKRKTKIIEALRTNNKGMLY